MDKARIRDIANSFFKERLVSGSLSIDSLYILAQEYVKIENMSQEMNIFIQTLEKSKEEVLRELGKHFVYILALEEDKRKVEIELDNLTNQKDASR